MNERCTQRNKWRKLLFKKKASDSKRAQWLNAHWKVSAGNVDELFSYIYLYIYIKTILGSSKWIWGPFTCTSCYCNPSLIKETYFFDLQSICKKDSWSIFSLDDFIWVELERKCKVNYGRRGTSEVTVYMTAGGKGGAHHQGGGGICTPRSSYAKMFQKMAKRRKVMKEKTMTHQEHCFCRLSS